MYYTVYKVTNKVNGKYYIGKHQTALLTDSYMGSGKLLRRAIQKHGSHNFVKEILHTFDNEADMNAKEKELVVVSEETYNICEGGKGGFGYINNKRLNLYGKNGQPGYGGENFILYRKKAKPKEKCLNCDQPASKYGKKFCSHSCAAAINNKGIKRNPFGRNQHSGPIV